MEHRKLTKEDIDKVRSTEGFPIGTDEDIIAISDAPRYTACPNPFINEFIEENGIPYDEKTDIYQREPFASDVSEGKNDPIYMAHTYHTKVPYKAIVNYIMHYTNPGDVIFDGFCGSGMTGFAAQICGRKAVISDLSPIATFIASNYTDNVDVDSFMHEFLNLMKEMHLEYDWMYKTKHTNGDFGTINYVIWSDVFICPSCGQEFVFWDNAVSENKELIDPFFCKNCGAELKKSSCKRAEEPVYDKKTRSIINQAKQVPAMINYIYKGKKYEKRPDEDDLLLLERVKKEKNKYNIPSDELPEGDNTDQPKQSHKFYRVDQFYYDRSAIIFSAVIEKAQNLQYRTLILFVITSILTKTGSKLHNIGFKNGKINLAGAVPNVLYIPSLVAERNIINLLENKVKDICKIYDIPKNQDDVLIQTCSANDTNIPADSIDYIFTDPPFGNNINYSEMNYIWEAWLHVKTNNTKEAIINKTQKKSLLEYQALMTDSFSEFYRILKPGRWMTVEFHNSKNSVWNAIQEAIQRAGFIIADVRTLDKKQATFKQMTSISAVKQDLVISAYKPREKFEKEFKLEAGTEESAWSFVRQHLANIPVVVMKSDKIEVIAERQAYLLFDRMVAYHIMKGIPVPLNATDFYRGLDERFIVRDGMYFLPDQINKYDSARIMANVEDLQFDLFVTNEKSAISWLYQQLSDEFGGPKTYAQLQPMFMQEVKAVDKYEEIPELSILLEENFLQDDKGYWYIPDVTKEGDIAKLREKNLWKEFEGYMNSKGKLKSFRSEAIRVGFSHLWKEKNYQGIVKIAERLPEQIIQEDPDLLMYYDLSLGRV